MEYTRESIRLFAQSYRLISIYRGIFANPVGASLKKFLDLLAETDDPDMRLITAYSEFFANLAAARADASLPAFFIEAILKDVNVFTANPVAASNYVSDAILTDLECIQAICMLKAEALRDYLRSLYILTEHEEYLPLVSRLPLFFNEVGDLDQIGRKDGSLKSWHLMYKSLVFALETPEAFVAMLPRLRKFHETSGCGIFCRYPAAYFDGELQVLSNAFHPKDQEFFDYNGMCVKLIENTARFLVHGERKNALISGPARLGKTTTLRLLPDQFTNAGYRYLELCFNSAWTEQTWQKLLEILQQYAKSNLKFVLAILRLERPLLGTGQRQVVAEMASQIFANQIRYALPANCLIYASYDGAYGDFKASYPELADQFPLHLEFAWPNQEEYLASVYAFANLAGFDVDNPELTAAALTYAEQKQAHDLDVARDFVEVWRFMQNDQLVLTYDKVQANQTKANKQVQQVQNEDVAKPIGEKELSKQVAEEHLSQPVIEVSQANKEAMPISEPGERMNDETTPASEYDILFNENNLPTNEPSLEKSEEVMQEKEQALLDNAAYEQTNIQTNMQTPEISLKDQQASNKIDQTNEQVSEVS